jgi:hypothetical protein
MGLMTRGMASVAAVFALVTLGAVGADAVKPIDEGKGSAFKSKSYDIMENGEVAVVLAFEAGKEVAVTTKGDKETDVHLHVKGKYYEAKDTSPSPACLVKFTPAEGDERFLITMKNNGPGANKVTLEVKLSD